MRTLLVAILVLAAASVEAALPASPFDVTLSSVALVEGQAVTVRIAATPGAEGGERYDVYLLLASVEEAAFLTPEGAWAPTPVPYARAMAPTDPPVVRQWPKAWPPGRYAFGLVVVPPSADPLDRTGWRYRPAITWFEIAPAAVGGGAALAQGTLALLGVAAGLAIALVWWAGTAPRSSGP